MAARVGWNPAGGSKALPDGAVHEGTRYMCSCMTSQARSSMCGYACRAKVRDVRVAALGPCASKFKNESIWNRKSKPRFRVNMDSRGRGETPCPGHRTNL